MTLETAMTACFLLLLLLKIVHMVVLYTFSYIYHFALKEFSNILVWFAFNGCLIVSK